MLNILPDLMVNWRIATEIIILWFIIYQIILFFEGSRAVYVLRGIIVLFLSFFLFQKFNFTVLDWLLQKLFGISVIAILIIFHPEIRQGLAGLGKRHIFRPYLKEEELDVILKEIDVACENLLKNKIGALIVVEKDDPLLSYAKSGVLVDAKISAELIEAIFTPNNPLHDGACVIQHSRILASGCILPLSQKQDLSRLFGTRHRAALGISEETDALVIVVSEERSDISLVHRGRLYRDLGTQEFLEKAKELIKLKNEN